MTAPLKTVFFSWNGPIGRALDAWGRHQRWWWIAITSFVLMWFAYDVGQLVARADVFSAVQGIKGTITIDQAVEKSSTTQGGRLIIISPTTARFVETSGTSWDIPNFAKSATQKHIDTLEEHGVTIDGAFTITVRPVMTKPGDLLFATISDLAVKVVFIGFYAAIFYFVMRHMRGTGQQRYHQITATTAPPVTIQDVAGYDGVKTELLEVVDYLRDPTRFTLVGARPPRGVLLYGPPGNGKTLMAKAVAGEAAAAFFEQSASSFVQIYAGEGAKSVRKLFEDARKAAPAVIFIDEIDAVGGSRSGGSHDERVQTLNAILTEMDGFQNNTGLVVVAATNRMDTLDEALVRPGRFDRKVWVGMPTSTDRLAILNRHAQKIAAGPDVDWTFWAAQTKGFSGADLAALVNEAAIEAARDNQSLVHSNHMERARDRVWIGAKNHGQVLTDADRQVIAVHELGHAWMRLHTGGRVEKISIAPRGQSLGVTVTVASDDKMVHTKDDAHKEIVVLMGGRAAEQVICGHVTGGALDDMNRASALARDAVMGLGASQWGAYIPKTDDRKSIDDEAAKWVNDAYKDACDVIQAHQELLKSAVRLLLEKDELNEVELLAIWRPELPAQQSSDQ